MNLQGSVHMHHPHHLNAPGDLNMTSMMSDDDDPSFSTEDSVDGQTEIGKGKKTSSSNSLWHRVKWTDGMVRLLITAVSYIGEDIASEACSGPKRKAAVLLKKGKWKVISKVMAERGCFVSPQQCEDKFNDLNKRYKRLTDILGRGTSCKVVENPALLGMMNHLSEKVKDDVRKILSSKQLFYEEMCSYHNGNRFRLPADPALHRSLLAALGSGEERDTMQTMQEGVGEGDDGGDSDDEEYANEGCGTIHTDVGVSCFPKRMKGGVSEEVVFRIPSASHDCDIRSHPQGISVDMNQVIPEGSNTEWPQKQSERSRALLLEEQRLHIQAQMLELQQQRLELQQISQKKDMELDKMRIENMKMELENEQLALELKRTC